MTRIKIQAKRRLQNLGPQLFSLKSRKYFSKDASLNVYYLKTHLTEELIRHKHLGLFNESLIERVHHIGQINNRLFGNIKNWFNRQEAIENRRHVGDAPDVHEARRSLEDKSKRDLAASTVEASANKATKDKEEKTEAR